jgi:hypothetical protein
VLRSANADGSGATEITSAQRVCAATVAMALTTTDYVTGTSPVLPAFTLSNEYLFMQLAWKRVTAASMTTADVVFRTGSTTVDGCTFLSCVFVPAVAGFRHSFATMTG